LVDLFVSSDNSLISSAIILKPLPYPPALTASTVELKANIFVLEEISSIIVKIFFILF